MFPAAVLRRRPIFLGVSFGLNNIVLAYGGGQSRGQTAVSSVPSYRPHPHHGVRTHSTMDPKTKRSMYSRVFTHHNWFWFERSLWLLCKSLSLFVITGPYHTIPYHTIPYHTIPYHTTPYHTIPYHTIPYHTIPYHTIPYHTNQNPVWTQKPCIPLMLNHVWSWLPCSSWSLCLNISLLLLGHTMPYHTIPYHTTPYHTIPYHAIPYRTNQNPRWPQKPCISRMSAHYIWFWLLCSVISLFPCSHTIFGPDYYFLFPYNTYLPLPLLIVWILLILIIVRNCTKRAQLTCHSAWQHWPSTISV